MGSVADNVTRKLKEIATKMSGSVEVGFLEGATYPDGTPVAAVAFWDEYGHGGQFPAPPRPFFRTMIEKEKPTWGGKVGALMKATGDDGAKTLALMGEDIQGALIKSINDLTAPALSPTTLILRQIYGNQPESIRARDVIAAQELVAEGYKGATGTQAKPLIWTGHMVNLTGYKVMR
jgi:hypothetical protein